MHYIKDIFASKATEHAHDKFVRYSKGVFVGPLLNVRLSKTNFKLSGSFHFVDEFLEYIAKAIGNKEVHVKGTLIWNSDLSVELASLGIKYSKVSKSRGIFKYQLENDVNIKDFVNVMGKYHLLINIKSEDISMTTKNSFPKPNKEFTADFCKLALPVEMAKEVLSEFAFDVKFDGIKTLKISHEIIVNDIKLPEDAPDFETARREARRIGNIKRVVEVNGEEPKTTEIDFNI